MDDLDDLAAVYSLQVDRGDPEVRASELALDHAQENAFPRHLNCMGATCAAQSRSMAYCRLLHEDALTHLRFAGLGSESGVNP